MIWQFYLCALFAGIFLANAIPHFVQGISGNKFPTPFATWLWVTFFAGVALISIPMSIRFSQKDKE
jgi:hypothetical protein